MTTEQMRELRRRGRGAADSADSAAADALSFFARNITNLDPRLFSDCLLSMLCDIFMAKAGTPVSRAEDAVRRLILKRW